MRIASWQVPLFACGALAVCAVVSGGEARWFEPERLALETRGALSAGEPSNGLWHLPAHGASWQAVLAVAGR